MTTLILLRLSNFRRPADSVGEATATKAIGVQLSGLAEMPITVTLASAIGGTATSGVDYSGAPQIITIPAQTLTSSGTLTVSNDSFYEGNEVANLELLTPSAGTLTGQTTMALTLVESAALPFVKFSSPSSSVAENIVAGELRLQVE